MAISIFNIGLNMMECPILVSSPFVASALITNGNVNAAKLG